MKTSLLSWNEQLSDFEMSADASEADLVVYFGDTEKLAKPYEELRTRYPEAQLIGCSSGGQILNQSACSHTFAAAAIKFASTSIRSAQAKLETSGQSYNCGKQIGDSLREDDLSGILVLSDGTNVNGSALTGGISDVVGDDVTVIGGLAGDGKRFNETYVGVNEPPQTKTIAAIGFYGDRIRFGCGSEGGWTPYGPKREITKSSGNILYEIDGKPALELYIKYLGDEAKDLPGSALFFPLAISSPDKSDDYVVRTILNVDMDEKSMTFAGSLPEGYTAQFMRSNFEGLSLGAAEAARQAHDQLPDSQLALLVSCIGRWMVMGQQVEDELDAVAMVLPPDIPKFGFYSYGEICPNKHSKRAKLHNETMTITVMSEA